MNLISGLEHAVERNVLVDRPQTSRCPIDFRLREESLKDRPMERPASAVSVDK